MTIFHEPWWLSAVSGGRHDEVVVKQGDDVVARLAFVADKTMGFRRLRMPDFTHVLGPDVTPGKGKPQTLLTRRLSIVRSLIDALPRFDFLKLALDPSVGGGLASADGLAFQERGFLVRPQYNYRLDCRAGTDKIWAGMDFKTRQHIRRAQEKYTVETLGDADEFVNFYNGNLERRERKSRFDLAKFSRLFSECGSRQSGEVLVARSADGSPVAMTFLVWDRSALYYLLSTRAHDTADGGAISLLIWQAMNKAHDLRLSFDFDGISTSGTARFYAGFGGEVCTRLIVTKATPLFAAAQYLGGLAARGDRESFRYT